MRKIQRPLKWLYCSTDYECAELRSWAQCCLWMFGKSSMAELFQKDPKADPHLELAANILGITSEEAKRRKAVGDKEIKGVRQMCKAVNFGLPGGMRAKKLRESARRGYGVLMTEAEAEERVLQWEAKWVEAKPYLNMIRNAANNAGSDLTVKQMAPPGHGPHRVRGGVGFCDAANGFFQGLTSDGAKEALWRITRECYADPSSPLYGCRPVAMLYDEVITEVPEHRAHEAAMRQAQLMIDAMQVWTPNVPAVCEPALMSHWTKEAESKFDANGRLVKYQPKLDEKMVNIA